MGSLVKGVECKVRQCPHCTYAIASSKATGSNKSIVMSDPESLDHLSMPISTKQIFAYHRQRAVRRSQ